MMGFKKLIEKKQENKPKLEITLEYVSGSKRATETFKAYALLGKWIALNFKRIRIIGIKVNGDY